MQLFRIGLCNTMPSKSFQRMVVSSFSHWSFQRMISCQVNLFQRLGDMVSALRHFVHFPISQTYVFMCCDSDTQLDLLYVICPILLNE